MPKYKKQKYSDKISWDLDTSYDFDHFWNRQSYAWYRKIYFQNKFAGRQQPADLIQRLIDTYPERSLPNWLWKEKAIATRQAFDGHPNAARAFRYADRGTG